LKDAQNLRGFEVEFHGDMRLISNKSYREYVARFTHGALEWIKPLAEGEAYDPVARQAEICGLATCGRRRA
jgi:hypothetical protein